MQQFGYAQHGLQQIRARFYQPYQLPKFLQLSQQIIQSLKALKQKYPLIQIITSKFNIALMISWIIDDINQLNVPVFQLESSELNVILSLLKMMEIYQLLKGLNNVHEMEGFNLLVYGFKEKLGAANQKLKEYCSKITDKQCKILSQKICKSRDILIANKDRIIKDNRLLISALIQLDIHCVFSNLMQNFRKRIRSIWLTRSKELKKYYKSIKLLEIKTYYLSAVTFSIIVPYIRQLYDDGFHMERKITFVYLIHDQNGIKKINQYFQEAPLSQFEDDMDLLTEVINKRFINQMQ